jgi:hypothetical protein
MMDGRESFISYLNSLNEDYYFFIANTVLGRVPTPFHKPVLNDRIVSFLMDSGNRSRIRASVNTDERKYLSFLLIAGSAAGREIGQFFSTDSYPVVITCMDSLKDRLIVLCTDGRYTVNPILGQVAEDLFDPDLMAGEDISCPVPGPFADRNVVCACLNLLIGGSVPVREANAHHFMKSGRLSRVFPQFPEQDCLRMFTLFKKLFIRTGVLTIRDSRFILDRSKATALLKSGPLGILMKAVPMADSRAVSVILGFLRTHGMYTQSSTSLYSIIAGTGEEQSQQVFDDMKALGFLLESGDRVFLNPAVAETGTRQSHLSMDSDMEVSYYGIPDENDILFMFADIDVCDRLVRYHITRSSFTRALDNGLTREQIQSYLGIPDNEQMKMWEASFSRITVYDGIVIRCDDQVARIVRIHPQIKDHIIKELPGNVFLMDRNNHSWQDALAYAMDIPDLPIPVSQAHTLEPEDSESEEEPVLVMPPAASTTNEPVSEQESEKIREDLLSYASRTGCLTDDVRELVNARLIVSESQIGKNFRYATLPSASGFDYNAKIAIIRAALRRTDKEEVPLLRLELTDDEMIVQPVELMKGDSKGSVLKARIMPDGMERSFPVSSVYRVTVLRWTLS